MARMLGGLPILLLASVLAHSDISEDRLRQLSTRLSPDGLAGRLGETLKTEGGRKAVEERVTLLLAAPLLRARRDAYGLFEELSLFVGIHFAEREGRYVVRPEREGHVETLLARAEALRRQGENKP